MLARTVRWRVVLSKIVDRTSSGDSGNDGRSPLNDLRRAREAGDFDTAVIFAGEGLELNHSVEPAADLILWIGAKAEALLLRGPSLLCE